MCIRDSPYLVQNFFNHRTSRSGGCFTNEGNIPTFITFPKASKNKEVRINLSQMFVDKSPASMGFLDTKYIDILKVAQQILTLDFKQTVVRRAQEAPGIPARHAECSPNPPGSGYEWVRADTYTSLQACEAPPKPWQPGDPFQCREK